MKNKIFLSFTFICIFLVILAFMEIFFRFQNPFKIRMAPKNYYESMVNKDQSYSLILENKRISYEKMDPLIILKRNSLGFRGREWPSNPDDYFKIIAMGGSTTECIVLSDGTTWPDLISQKMLKDEESIFVSNAGVNGQSSFGHTNFLKNYVKNLKPQVILFLLGANEQNEYYLDPNKKDKIDYGNDYERDVVKNIYRVRENNDSLSLSSKFFNIIERYKESSKLFLNISELRRRYLASKLGLDNQFIDFNSIEDKSLISELNQNSKPLNETEIDLKLLEQNTDTKNRAFEELEKQREYQKLINRNLLNLIKTSRENNIDPVFITQPALFGEGIDPTTGVSLSSMVLQQGNVGWGQGLTGKEMWTMLESYNDIVRKVAKENNVLLIDLARKMAKDSKYYYDFVHYGKEGAQEVARIIYSELCPHLRLKHKLAVKCTENQ